jgi:hypothetical protein
MTMGWLKKIFSPAEPDDAGTAPALEALEWVATPQYGGGETRKLVRKSDGRILIDILHGRGPGDPWQVFQNGAGRGDYLTEEQAKRRGEMLAKKERR